MLCTPAPHISNKLPRHKQLSHGHVSECPGYGRHDKYLGQVLVEQWDLTCPKVDLEGCLHFSKLFTLLFVKRSIQELCLAKERMCGCFAARTISANGLNSSGNQQGHQPNMQMRRKVVESLCIWRVCEDHPALVWRGIHVSQNILRRI